VKSEELMELRFSLFFESFSDGGNVGDLDGIAFGLDGVESNAASGGELFDEDMKE